MIRDVLLPALIANFSNRGFRAEEPPNVGVFPAANLNVGDVTIVDDNYEATIYIGDITHGHFGPYDERVSDAQIAQEVTVAVVDFLKALFDDRVLLFKSPTNGSGGWQVMGYDHQLSLDANMLTYLWSGPTNPDIIGGG